MIARSVRIERKSAVRGSGPAETRLPIALQTSKPVPVHVVTNTTQGATMESLARAGEFRDEYQEQLRDLIGGAARRVLVHI